MPRPKQDYDRVIGVYGRTVVTYDAREQRRISETMESEGAAEAHAQKLREAFARQALTVGSAAFEYLAGKTVGDLAREMARQNLYSFFGEQLDAPLSSLTAPWCQARYEQLVTQYAAATHHFRLKTVKEFGRWCVTKKLLQVSPVAEILPVGVPNRGKEQLTLDEARLLAGVLQDELAHGTRREEALVVLSCLYLGTRISEVLCRKARDLDDRGTVLRIPYGKSPNAVRRLRLPDELQPHWQAWAKDKLPEAPLFRVGRTKMWHWVHTFCRRAGVPEVCPHSFRGLHATLEVQAGRPLSAAAALLGHTVQMTARHYVSPGAVEQAKTDRVIDLFRG